MQRFLQRRQSAVGGLSGGGHHQRKAGVAVHHGRLVAQLHGDTGGLEQLGIAGSVISEWVVFGGADEGGGRPDRSAALAGARVAGSAVGSLMSRPGAYHTRNASMTSRSRTGASAFSAKDGSDRSPVTDGYHNSWNTSAGPPSSALSRARCAITAAMLPPAESPATAIRLGSPPSSVTCSPTHCKAAQLSSIPAGYGCSGARR